MIIRQAESVAGHDVDLEGAEGITFRMVLGEEEGAPNFYMRHFTVAPNGHTPFHTHDWEHEVYIISGRGALVTENGDKPLIPGDCVFVPAGEKHRFKNTGKSDLKFLCLVPAQQK